MILGDAADDLGSSFLCGEPIFDRINGFDKCDGTSGVQTSGDVGGILIGASTAGALIFCF